MHHNTLNRSVLANLSILADFAVRQCPRLGHWAAAVYFWAVNGFLWRSMRLSLHSPRELSSAYWLLAHTLGLQRQALAELIQRRKAFLCAAGKAGPKFALKAAEQNLFWLRLLWKMARAEHCSAQNALGLVLIIEGLNSGFKNGGTSTDEDADVQLLPEPRKVFFGRVGVLAMDPDEVYEKYRAFEADRRSAYCSAERAGEEAIQKCEDALASIEKVSKMAFTNAYAEKLVSERTRAMARVLRDNLLFLKNSERRPIGARLNVDRRTGLLALLNL